MLKMDKQNIVYLSFDVEEFDLPNEYGQKLSPIGQLEYAGIAIDALLPLIETLQGYRFTFFVTANFAENFPTKIKRIADLGHEIASHTYFHGNFKDEDLITSKKTLENISGQTVEGLRMPKMQLIEAHKIKTAGYSYDASLNPVWLPGRYNHRNMPRTAFIENGILHIPSSSTPNFRIPLFWLSFKNFPLPIFVKLALQTLKKDGYLCLYFHPWEFMNLKEFKLPKYISSLDGEKLLSRLKKLIQTLSTKAVFHSMKEFNKDYKLPI